MTNNENDIQQPSIEEIKRNAANKAASNITSSKTMPIKKGENNRSIEDIKREAAINASDDTINKKKSGTEDSIVPSKDGTHNLSDVLNGKHDGEQLPLYSHQDEKNKFELPQQQTSNEEREPVKNFEGNKLEAQTFLQKNNHVLREYFQKQGTYDKDFMPFYKSAIQGNAQALKKAHEIIDSEIDGKINALKAKSDIIQPTAAMSGMAAQFSQTYMPQPQSEDVSKNIAELEKQKVQIQNSFLRLAAGNPKTPEGKYLEPNMIGAKLSADGFGTSKEQAALEAKADKSKTHWADIGRQHADFRKEGLGYQVILDDLQGDYDTAAKAYKDEPTEANFQAVKKIENELNDKRSEYNNLDLKYPEVAKQNLAKLITDKIADSRNRLNPLNIIRPSLKEVKSAFNDLSKQYPEMGEKYNKVFMDLVLDKNMANITKGEQPIATGGFSGALGRGIDEVVGGFGLFDLATMSGEDRAAKQLSQQYTPQKPSFQESPNQTRIVVDKKSGSLVQRQNNLSNTFDNVVNLVGEQAPALVAFAGMEGFVSKTVGKAIAGTLKGATGGFGMLVEGVGGIEGGEALQMTKNAFKLKEGGVGQTIQHTIAMQGAQFGMSYARNYDESLLKFEDTPEGYNKASTSATLKTMAEGIAFSLMGVSPSKMLGGTIKSAIDKDLDEFITTTDFSKLSSKGISNKVYDIIYPKIEKLIPSTVKESIKMGGVSSVNAFVKEKIDNYISGQESEPTSFSEEAKKQVEIFKDGALMGAVFSAIPNLFSMTLGGKDIAPSHSETLMNLSLNPEASKYRAQKLFEKGTIDSNRRNEFIKVINTSQSALHNAVESARNKNVNFDNLKPSAQQKLLLNHFRQQYFNSMAKDSKDNPELKEQALAKKAELQKEELGLLTQEKETLPITDNFVSSLGIKLGDENGKEIKSINDLQPEGDYFINGKKVNMLDAQNHIYDEAVKTIDAERFTDTDAEVLAGYEKRIKNDEKLSGHEKKEFEELQTKKADYDKQQEFIKSVKKQNEKVTDTTPEKDSRQKSEGDKPEADKEATTQNLIPTIKVGENEYSGKNHGEAMERAIAAGEKIPSPDTEEGKIWRRDNAMFKDMRSENKDLLTRDEAGKKYGIRNSEQLSDNKPLADKDIVPTFDEIKKRSDKLIDENKQLIEVTQPVINSVNNAEYVNEKQLSDAADVLYDLWDKAPEARHLIEPLISKLENYEFATKTETRTVTEKKSTGTTAKTKREIKPVLEQSAGSEASITTADGNKVKGILNIKSGQYVLDVTGGIQRIIGETQITNRDLKLPSVDKVENPIQFDNDGNVKSVTFETKDGNLVTIENPEKALDLAIQLQADALGEIPDEAFMPIYEDIVKEIQVEVPKNDITKKSEPKKSEPIPEDIPSQKPNTDGKDKKSGEETDAAKKEGEESNVNNKGDETTPPLPPVVDEVENFEKNIPENIVGIKNSIVDESRIHRGLMPLVKAAKRKLGKIWNDLRKDIANGDANPNKLVDDTFTKIINYKSDKDRVIFNTYQNAQLLFHRLDVTNRIKTSEDILQGIENLPSDAKIEDIAKMFEDKADWMFKNDADKAKFKELLSDKEVDAELVKKALGDVINDFHFDLQKNDKIAESIGNEWGVSGAFRGLLVNLQGEVVNWTKQLERQMGEHSDPETLKTISGLEQEYKETIEKLKTAHTEELQKAAEDAYKKAQDLFRKEAEKNKSQSIATKAKTLKQSGKEAADNIRKFKIKTDPNTLQLSILGLPIAVYNTLVDVVSGIVEGGATIAQAIEQVLKDDRFKSVKRNDLINHLTGKISFEGNRENILKDLKEHSIDNKETAITKDNVKKVKNLMSLHIQNGTESLDDLLKKTKDDIKEILPDASEDDIRDALSGRGVKQDTIQKAQTELQRIKQQAVNVGKYVDLLKAPENETESERLKRVKKLNELYEGKDGSGIKAEIEKMGIVPPNDQLRLKDINDKRINNIKVGVKNIVDNIKSSLTKGVKNDAEKSILNDEKSRLNGKLKDLETGKFSQDQRFAQANNIISDQILNHERDRQKLTNIFRKDKPKVGTPEYEAEKEKIDAYTDRIKQLKKIKNDLDVDNKLVSKDVDNQIVAAKLQDALNRSISKMQNSIDNNEFEETEPSKKMGLESIISQPDFAKTKQIRDLERQRNLIELKKRDAIDKYNKSKRGIAAKIADGVVKSKRMFVLVKGAILAKLAAAVMWGQTVFAPLNTLAGAVWNKVGDFASGTLGAKEDIRDNTTWGRFLDKSLRYGRVSAQSELQAYGKAWSWDNFKNKKGFLGLGITNETAKRLDGFKNESTLKSFVSDLNNNYNELSLLFGKDVAPSEYYATVTDEVKFFQKDFWNTVGSGLDFGKGKDVAKGALRVGGKAAETVWQAGEYGIRAHGAIKSIAKGMEFARSYFTIKENARRLNGEAWVNDPVNQMSMGMLAYQEAVRGILMEDNIVTGAYQRMIKSMKKGEGLGSQAAYLTAGELMPVVKVPTNIALQAGRATLGLPLSGGEIVARLISEKLSGTNIAKITGTGEFFKRNGTEVVSNEHASALLRNLRTGTVGGAMIMGMVLGSMAASNYYFKHKKGSIEEDYGTDKLEEGEVRIGNVTIARDLADNPYFVGAKMAETAWKAFNYYHEGQSDPDGYLLSMAKALGVTAAGVIKESPISSTPTTLMAGLEGQQNMGWFWRGLVVSSTYPSMMREMAMYTDKEDGNLIPFKGKTTKRLSPTLMDTYKAWTPILRETLQKK